MVGLGRQKGWGVCPMTCAFWVSPPSHGALFTGVVRTTDKLDETLVRANIVGTDLQCAFAGGCGVHLYGFQLIDE